MKLARYICIFTLLIIQTRATAQESEQDPLLGNYRLGNSAEIVLLWAERSSSSSESDQRIYDFLNLNNPDPNVPDQLQPQDLQMETDGNGIDGDRQMDVITGDFNGDSADDLIGVWEGPDQSINMIIPSINKGMLNWSNSNVMAVLLHRERVRLVNPALENLILTPLDGQAAGDNFLFATSRSDKLVAAR